MQKVSQQSVNYRDGDKERHCGNCIMFHSKSKACDLVNGIIIANGVCNKWEAKKK